MSSLILYNTEDGNSQIRLRAEQQTVWLTQLEMAELFVTTKQNISLHLKNRFEDEELSEESVVKESLTTATEGKRYSISRPKTISKLWRIRSNNEQRND